MQLDWRKEIHHGSILLQEEIKSQQSKSDWFDIQLF